MDQTARWVMAGLAVFILWRLIRAAQTGTIFSEGYAFSAADQPTWFIAVAMGHAVCIGLCLWVVAGYSLPDLLSFCAGW